jgi:hypothetical protein
MKKFLARSAGRGVWLVVGTLVGGALVGGVAYAAIPATGGVIQGCYNTASGQLRVLHSSASKKGACTKAETAIHWNETGLKGQAGVQGSKGDTGAKGLTGTPGAAGTPGATGAIGLTGSTGAASTVPGPTGATGPPGSQSLNVQQITNAVPIVNGSGTNQYETDATCPPGYTVIGGGVSGLANDYGVLNSAPDFADNIWKTRVVIIPNTTETITAYASCERFG